ncbi:hypothetical protein CPB84DRAFT_1772703 [Gymnopilus junonius]|uniref:Uncharacterized protein n=1 Tax=Gymnopilus junonius TaxID=109634 RepID=A0A9P5NU69_GYMJU|nr:hypothetical protein CPB84DRAFT_1772703 [Gymnopilus junonius]
MRFDSAKLFGNLFNEWLTSGDSVALRYQAVPEDVEGDVSEELYEQKEKFTSIVFDDYPVDTAALTAYLQDLFSSDEAAKALDNLRKDLKNFAYYFQRRPFTSREVLGSIKSLLASGLMDEEKRTTLKAFQENPTVVQEVASVLTMRLASLESWTWPKEGLPVEFRRHFNGKYR